MSHPKGWVLGRCTASGTVAIGVTTPTRRRQWHPCVGCLAGAGRRYFGGPCNHGARRPAAAVSRSTAPAVENGRPGEPPENGRQGASPASCHRKAPALPVLQWGTSSPGAPGRRLGQPGRVSTANHSKCSVQRNGSGGLPEPGVTRKASRRAGAPGPLWPMLFVQKSKLRRASSTIKRMAVGCVSRTSG